MMMFIGLNMYWEIGMTPIWSSRKWPGVAMSRPMEEESIPCQVIWPTYAPAAIRPYSNGIFLMRSSLASSLASSAPTMRLRPQCRKEARTDTKVTSQAACLPLLAIPASLRMPFFAMGASATADPVMMIRHICIAKASNSHRPLYQF